ncbi:MAG: NAD-dependent dehydratase [Acidobacteria bacterium]|nr:NAD-dependent dehydratase [Acidobacteriota bacterium]
MNWSGRRVLVTGAAGFIASHLCEALIISGADVTAMTHYNSRGDHGNLEHLASPIRSALHVAAGNIEDGDFVASLVEGKEVVFHLAALIGIPYSYVAPRSYVRTNIEGTLNVLEAARRFRVGRLVHTSTSEAYGTALYTPIDEKHPLQGQSPYSASKIGADKMVESYHRSFGLPVATLRPFNTFGPRQSARAVIPTIVSQALREDVVRLGALDPVRDLTYVADTVDAFVKIADAAAAVGQVVNVGTGRAISVGDLAALILERMGSTKQIVADTNRLRPVDSEVNVLLCDATRAKAMIGWTARWSLVDGLDRTIEFVTAHPELFRSSEYAV